MTIQHFADAGWGNEDWGLVSAAVRETIQISARVRSVLPSGPSAPLAYNVAVPMVVVPPGVAPLTLNTAGVQQPIRVSRDFLIQVNQLHDRDGIVRVARRAAHLVAAAEDMILLFGGLAIGTPILGRVNTINLAATTPGIWSPDGNAPTGASADPTAAVQTGIAALEGRGYYGPYAILMTRPLWTQTASVAGDRAQKSVIGEILGTEGALEPVPDPAGLVGAPFAGINNMGVVFARGSHAFDFVQIEPPSVAFVDHVPAADGILLRVEERFVLRVIEPLASYLIGT